MKQHFILTNLTSPHPYFVGLSCASGPVIKLHSGTRTPTVNRCEVSHTQIPVFWYILVMGPTSLRDDVTLNSVEAQIKHTHTHTHIHTHPHPHTHIQCFYTCVSFCSWGRGFCSTPPMEIPLGLGRPPCIGQTPGLGRPPWMQTPPRVGQN